MRKYTDLKIGVLALQGAFIEHETMLTGLGAACAEIRQPSDLAGLSGIVLPGGESTVQGQLLHKSGLFAPLQKRIAGGLPTLATCAGLILLAEKISPPIADNKNDVLHVSRQISSSQPQMEQHTVHSSTQAEKENSPLTHLGTLPVTVRRNAYGRQLSSFVTEKPVKGIGNYPMIFIRAPYVERADEHVEILAKVDGNIVAVKYRNQIGLSFHPELSDNPKIHEWFLSLCQREKNV